MRVSYAIVFSTKLAQYEDPDGLAISVGEERK